MRILYLITKSEIGGAQIHLAHLLENFSKDNAIALMSSLGGLPAQAGWLNDEALKYGVKIYPNIFFSNSFNPFKLLSAMRSIKQAVKDFKPDLICCHSSMAGFLGRLAIRNRVPTVYTAHGFAFTPAAPFWRRIMAVIGEKIVSRYTSKIITVSEYDKKLALKFKIAKPSKLITVHNGVKINPLENREKKEPVEILSIGRLAYPKLPDLAIRAFSGLAPELRRKAHLKIAGVGPYFDKLNDLIIKLGLQESVFLSGEIDHERMLSLLPKADIFILITKHEGLPLTVLEAMSNGLPVIASNVGGIPEEINSECGILIQKNDVAKIIEALASLIEDADKRVRMGLAGHKRAEDIFSLKKFLSDTEQIYKEVLSSKS